MGAAACRKRRKCPLLAIHIIVALVLASVDATGRRLSSPISFSQQDGSVEQQLQLGLFASGLASFTVRRNRQLLQSSYVATVCDAYNKSVNEAVVKEFASKLLGDNRLAVTDARFSGACNAFGLATISAPHVLSSQLGGALVLSTGDAAAALADLNTAAQPLSTDWQQPGDAMIGSYTYDAAVLEIDISVAPSDNTGSSQLVLSYVFASEEYGTLNPNPDAFSITAKTSSSSDLVDLALLPGGRKIPPPSAFTNDVPVDIYKNTGAQYRTALNGFTQVVPTQGLSVQNGGSYTLRISIADANNGLVDSVVMLPVGSLKLQATPVISSGGPYAVAPNAQMTLTAAKSTSDNGAILAYQWSIFPYNNTGAAVATAAGPTVSMTAPPIGQYNVTLDIWDVLGGHAQESTALSVDATNILDWWTATPSFATPAPLALPKPTAVIDTNGSTASTLYVNARSDSDALVQFDASQSTDGRGSKLAYAWKLVQTQPAPVAPVKLMLGYKQPAKFQHSFAPGVYLIDLEVSGPGGSGGAQSLLTVKPNNPPVASAGGPYTTTVGVPVIVSAGKSSDPDGDPLAYSWVLYRDNVPIGKYSGATLSMKLNKAGTYTVKLTVTDDRGASASATAQITSYESLPASTAAATPVYTHASVSQTYTQPATTTAVVAAVPAPAPAAATTTTTSGLRLADPSTAAAATTTPTYTQSVYTPAATAAATVPGASPAPAMCLFNKNGTSSTNKGWSRFNLFALTNTYWAPCNQASTAAAPVSGSNTVSVPSSVSDPLASTAVIRSPEAFVTATGAATQVYLDASGSTAAAGRSLVAFAWTVKQQATGAVITQVDGLRTPVWLAPGVYSLQLVVTDTSGQTASTTREFSIGDAAETLAFISSPGIFVENLDAGAVDVQLSAAGSKAGPGRSLINYWWAVYRLPDNAQLTTQQGPTATVALPVGSYRVYLAVFDSVGGNATTYKDLVVGSRDLSGVTAVITWPPAVVQAATGDSATKVALDGSGSAAAGNDSSISQYIWAVVSMPSKQPVANATGRLTTINLPPGLYQVGLLIIDSLGNTGAARKNFAISGTAADVNRVPAFTSGLSFCGTAGGSFDITGVTDPDGDSVTITWALMNQATGRTTQGKGATVSLEGLPAGKYLLLVTANDGRGGESSGTATVTVTSSVVSTDDATAAGAANPLPSSGESSSGSRLSAPATTPTSSSSSSIAVGPSAIGKLPTVALPLGATMELDAASFDLLPADVKLDAFVWELKQRSTGEQIATVYSRMGHFELSAVGTFDMKLTAYDTAQQEYSSTGTVKVAPAEAEASNGDSGVLFTGTCGPFSGKQYTAVALSCPSLTVTGASGGLLKYAWKITTPTGGTLIESGKRPLLVGLSPGHYKVELAISSNGSPPDSQNTALYLVTYLVVKANNQMQLDLPESLCYGQAVSLKAPALVQEGGIEPEFVWQVLWVESQRLLGYRQVMQGEGRTFGFTLQTGHYEVVVNATLMNGEVIQGKGNITALPCLTCKSGVVPVQYAAGKCTADNSLTRQVLLDPVPEGVLITWASGTVTSPGQRKVTITSKSVTAGLAASCSAVVNFTDVEPPTVTLMNAAGMCMTPPNNRWSCWQANQLVRVQDNCQAQVSMASMILCHDGSTAEDCQVLPDGRVCVKAAPSAVGQSLKLRVLARDGFGNIAQTLVPVQVRSVGPTAVGCQIPKWSSPEAAATAQ